jgi:hypothetical protein
LSNWRAPDRDRHRCHQGWVGFNHSLTGHCRAKGATGSPNKGICLSVRLPAAPDGCWKGAAPPRGCALCPLKFRSRAANPGVSALAMLLAMTSLALSAHQQRLWKSRLLVINCSACITSIFDIRSGLPSS